MVRHSHRAASDNSDSARYQRGLQAYASQFQITPEQVPRWFADVVGDRFGQEAIQSAANAYTGFARASRGLMIIRDELSRLETN